MDPSEENASPVAPVVSGVAGDAVKVVEVGPLMAAFLDEADQVAAAWVRDVPGWPCVDLLDGAAHGDADGLVADAIAAGRLLDVLAVRNHASVAGVLTDPRLTSLAIDLDLATLSPDATGLLRPGVADALTGHTC